MEANELDRVFNEPIAQELFASNALARLAYVGRDGDPRVVPVGYVWRGDAFVVCTATNAPKVNALTNRPAVALTIDAQTQPPRVLLARGTASIEIVDGVPGEFLAATNKSMPEEQWDAFEAQARQLYPNMARITIAPHWAKILDFETRFPVAVEGLVSATAPPSDPPA